MKKKSLVLVSLIFLGSKILAWEHKFINTSPAPVDVTVDIRAWPDKHLTLAAQGQPGDEKKVSTGHLVHGIRAYSRSLGAAGEKTCGGCIGKTWYIAYEGPAIPSVTGGGVSQIVTVGGTPQEKKLKIWVD